MTKKRYVTINDKFEIKCRKCGSTEVDIWADSCDCCGESVVMVCNKCRNEYDYHKFEMIEEASMTKNDKREEER